MALPEELVEEVLLRLPPAEPACLFRAAAVCKPWRRLVSEPRFRRRYREFHRSPPTLGFVCNTMGDAGGYVARFVPAATSGLPHAAHHHHGDGRRWWRALGVCHGRVLLHDAGPVDRPNNPLKKGFVIWDPITDRREELPLPPSPWPSPSPSPLVQRYRAAIDPHSWNAALVCAAAGGLGGTGKCDDLDCHGRHFLVVLVVDTTTDSRAMFTYVYSSEAGAWRRPTEHSLLPYHQYGVKSDPSVFVGNALYFLSRRNKCIFKYDLGTRRIFVILLPVGRYSLGRIVLMAMEDGRLGLATMDSSKLSLWSREGGCRWNDYAGWAVSRVIDFKALHPAAVGEPTQSFVVGCAGSAAVIFVFLDGGIFTVDLNSSQITEVCRASWPVDVFPYLNFYTPTQVTDSEQVPQVLEKH